MKLFAMITIFCLVTSVSFAGEDLATLKAENARLKKENEELRAKLNDLTKEKTTPPADDTVKTEKKFTKTIALQDLLREGKELMKRQKKNDSYSVAEQEKLASDIEAFKTKLTGSFLDFTLYVRSVERTTSLEDIQPGFTPKEQPLRVEFMLYPTAIYPAEEGSMREVFQSIFRVVWFTNNKAVSQITVPTSPSKEKPLPRFVGKAKIAKVKIPLFTIFLVDDDVLQK